MKKYIYTLIAITYSSLLVAQRTLESPVDLALPYNISLSEIGPNTTSVTNIISCSFGQRSNNDPSSSGPITGLEGHNFLENPAIIYPNPVKDVMSVRSADPITVIEILNLHGEVEQIMTPKEQELNVSDLPAGIYYVRISFEHIKTVQVEKILIVK